MGDNKEGDRLSPFNPDPANKPATDAASFTSDEFARLNSLKTNFRSRAEYLERMMDERRLEFARWLVKNGKLSEQI